MQRSVETEVKLSLSSRDGYPAHLFALGFDDFLPRVFERNTLFDTPDGRLKRNREVLRIREAGAKSTLTWKGKGSETGPHKSRPEIETAVNSASNLQEIVMRLGFAAVFVYEKYRTEFRREAGGIVTFDETPIGEFLELEGDPEWIDATARMLGFGRKDYILDSYVKLYLQHCRENGIAPSNMTFPVTG